MNEGCPTDDHPTDAGTRTSQQPTSLHHLVVIGGSAGSLEPLRQVVASLPRDLDCAVVVTVHHPPDAATFLPDILGRKSLLPVSLARNGEVLRAGRIYVSPPGYHNPTVRAGHVWVTAHPRASRRGSSSDSLFSSAAADFGPRCVGVVLSGNNRNGTAGLRDIRASGGYCMVQDPAEAAYPRMPLAALREGPDFVGSAQEIGRRIAEQCGKPPRRQP